MEKLWILLLMFSFFCTGYAGRYWDLVFKGVSGKRGGSNDIYELWIGSSTRNENNQEAKRIGFYSNGHYKSSKVNSWDTSTFSKVKLSAYIGGKERVRFIFRSSRTTKTTWMSKNLLTDSIQIINRYNFFSVTGDSTSNFRRRFFINDHYGGCDGDYGWFVVAEGPYCGWATSSPLPNIKFNPHTSAINLKSVSDADEMAVHFYKECPPIPDCIDVRCNSADDKTCHKCRDTALFKLDNHNLQCSRKCSYENRWCWPGDCKDKYARSCSCAPGFRRVYNSNTAVCQPIQTPNISTCQFKALSISNVELISKTNGTSECRNQQDIFGNFQVLRFITTLEANFQVILPLKYNNPKTMVDFVEFHHFGITDTKIDLVKISVTGDAVKIKEVSLKADNTGENAEEAYSRKHLAINYSGPNLTDGERLCMRFLVKGGGFLQSHNAFGSGTRRNVSYEKTESNRQLCYIYDKTQPEHSSNYSEPLSTDKRIYRSESVTIRFSDWIDRSPVLGKNLSSGIDSYEISLYDVTASTPNLLERGLKSVIPNIILNMSSSITIMIPDNSPSPSLFCVLLEVKDVANNVRQARRFILYDNSSKISCHNENKLTVTSASRNTNHLWQTKNGSICFSWKNRYINDKYKLFNPLRPIKPEPYGLIHGKYDQLMGQLPVNGTLNVYGIINFKYSIFKNKTVIIPTTDVPDFISQKMCITIPLKDGDTFDLHLDAIDIMSNVYNDSTKFHIDRSVPEIKNIWLVRDGYRQLYVHNSNDFRKIKLSFDALDPHSGLKTIMWTFGVAKGSADLGTGALEIIQLPVNEACPKRTPCYCPSVGHCAYYNFSLSMPKIVVSAQHNRRYFFSLRVTNNAMLSVIEHIDILVDESPPAAGVIMEGIEGAPDMDYSSEDKVNAHWHGFIDHESGIKFYRLALADRCLDKGYLVQNHYSNISIFETTDTAIKIPFIGYGKYFISIVAFNNAMEPSAVICSDGIVHDKSDPHILNMSLESASIAETVACSDGKAWLIRRNLSKVILNITSDDCFSRCVNSSKNSFIESLPVQSKQDSDIEISNFLCKRLSIYNNNIIYLPSDNIFLKWNIEDVQSQIRDVLIGIGSSVGSKQSPSLIQYRKTQHAYFFRKHHLGISTGTMFYVFVKVINKASLDNIATFGPIIIDETPPQCPGMFTTEINDGNVLLTWNDTTCMDFEQIEEIGNIVFRIGYKSHHVTPFLQWQLGYSHSCEKGNTRCIKYPMSHLQHYDNEGIEHFYFDLHVFNYAGHYTPVRSKTFKILPRVPPPVGTVFDLDPNLKRNENQNDVDAIFSLNRFCATWKFESNFLKGHYQIGLGNKPKSDDSMTFTSIDENSSEFCSNVTGLKFNTRYFVTLKLSENGRSSYSVSNGFVIIDPKIISSSLRVFDGKGCNNDSIIDIVEFAKSTEDNSFRSKVVFYVGRPYTARLQRNVSVQSEDILILNKTVIHETHVITFMTMKEIPLFYLEGLVQNETTIELQACIQDIDFQTNSDILSANWIIENMNQSFLTHYEVSLFKKREEICTKTFNTLSLSGKVGPSTFTFTYNRILQDGFYVVSVKPCVRQTCMEAVESNGVLVRTSAIETGQISAVMKDIQETCNAVAVEFEDFICSNRNNSNRSAFYRWAIFNDSLGNRQLSHWNLIRSNNSFQIKDSKCMTLPVYAHSTLYVCLEGYCLSGETRQRCIPLMRQQDPNEYNKHILYEVDISRLSSNLRSFIYSANIGNKLSWLHESELDFVSSHVNIGGVITGLENRHVKWYLQTTRNMSPEKKCAELSNCVISLQTSGGIVKFPALELDEKTIYYICAKVDSIEMLREGTDKEQIEGFNLCGDGFIVDKSPPDKGYVTIISEEGYVSANGHLAIEWSGFGDEQNALLLGYPSEISSYSYSIGTYPYGEDVQPPTTVGLSQGIILRHLILRGGLTYYATVTATDHAGHVTKATSCGVLFDNTPPITGVVRVGTSNSNQNIVNANDINVQWYGFSDSESGIQTFEVGVGSTKHHPDVIPFTEYFGDRAVLRREDIFHDGYQYYIFLRVTNQAGLSSSTLTEPFIMDSSPPTLGAVKDGFDSMNDLDYQLNTTHVGCHWHSFADPHSGIYYYNVGLGTARGQTDIRALTFNALQQDTVWNLDFVLGIRYFCLVEACNSAGLCSSQTSNGIILDNSAPIPGIVHVGIAGVHSKYISQTNTLQAQWIGFQDPHSDISHFEVCIGTEAGMRCDIMPMTNYLLSSSMTKTGLSMPIHVPLYATVRAYNKAGLHVDKSSDSFVIDTTPPTVVTRPYFETNKNITSYNNKSQFDLSTFKIIWKLEDHESPIIRQTLSLKTHHDGHTPLEEIQLTSENELLVTLPPMNWLHSGDTYLAHVTSCNQAGLCTTALSDELLIDSSPPHLGGFKPPMTWSTLSTESRQFTSINLTWYGFVDIESSIKGYFITVGSSYSGSDLSNGVIEINATNYKEQHTEIPLVQLLTEGQKIILSIWAENYAGLNSSIGKITVESVASTPTKTEGLLLIEKHSCDVEYCNRDCTCAVVGKSCDDAMVNATCNEIHQTDLGLNLSVHAGLDYYSEQKIISSSACISGNWKLTSYNSSIKVFRYEWSVGRHSFSVGTGIFKNENIWNDVGRLSSFTYCVPKIRPLVNGAKYIVYLKVWVSTHTFSVFQSPPVSVDITPPAIRKGRFIRISDHTCRPNMKYSRDTSQITACYDNVFSDEESGIRNYILTLGTSRGGYDIALSNCEKTETKRTWSNITLSAGTTYYVTVFAFNNAGLQSSATSYGLLIDNEKPYSGVVFNTKYHRNVVTQSSSNLGVSFHGFEDHHSSIKTYLVSVEEVTGNKTKIAMVFRSVGLINSFTINDINLNHGRKYQTLVKAVDAAGFESDVEVSPPILIDNTPPLGFSCKSYKTILDVTVSAKKHGITWKFQEVNETGAFYKLIVKLQPSSSNASLVMASNSLERKLFLASNPDGSSESEVYFFSDFADSLFLNAKPVLSIAQAHITLSQCTSLLINDSEDEFVHVRQISPSALSVDVSVLDKESGIKKIYLGVGTTAGGLQIKPLELMPLRTNLVLDVNVAHGTPVYVTALVENNAGSKKEFHSKPLRIDNTPPNIEKIDIDVQTNFSSDNNSISKIFVQWDSFDKESGIKECACAIDASSSNLVMWSPSIDEFILSDWLHLPQGTAIKATVRCVNNVGLERKILSKEYIARFSEPDSSGADIRFDHQAVTKSGLNVQSRTSKITFAWTDFTDPTGIASYFCRVVDNTTPLTNWVNVGLHNYATFENMALKNDHVYMAEVKAINKKDIYSQAINKSILILSITPQLTGRPAILSVHGKSLTLDWKDVFTTDERLGVTYKVSAGSMSGFTDVLHSLQTKQTHITTETEMVVSEIFVVIQARYDTGTTQLYKQSLN